MFEIGTPELEAVQRVITRGHLFRYSEPSECSRFERRFAEFLGVPQVLLCSSGSAALYASLVGLGLGPGDEVVVPAVTYMATATSVLAAGAIPVIVDVDESLTLDPAALSRAISPRTRAVIAVHMWGRPCDLEAIGQICEARSLLLIEDVCQAAGGGYGGRKLGSFGQASAFSFNAFKNLTCGEGGAVCAKSEAAFERMRCAVDCCNFFWSEQGQGSAGFAANSSRASEFEGAILNEQLNRLPRWLEKLRAQKAKLLEATADILTPAPTHSPRDDCSTHLVFQFTEPSRAAEFAERVAGQVASETGRHIYTRWAPVLERRGAHHPALDPFLLEANRECRKDYHPEMCQRSLDIASRSVLIALDPLRTPAEIDELISKLRAA